MNRMVAAIISAMVNNPQFAEAIKEKIGSTVDTTDMENQIRSIRQEKISGDNIYQLLLAFDEVYGEASEVERKEFMRAFIERIELYPEKREDGCYR